MTIEEMQLAPIAEEAARLLLRKHPNVQFTSGRRDIAQQAHAMAANIVALHDRKWIGKTYLAGAKLQAWVDSHPTAVTVEQITTGLVTTMNAVKGADRGVARSECAGRGESKVDGRHAEKTARGWIRRVASASPHATSSPSGPSSR